MCYVISFASISPATTLRLRGCWLLVPVILRCPEECYERVLVPSGRFEISLRDPDLALLSRNDRGQQWKYREAVPFLATFFPHPSLLLSTASVFKCGATGFPDFGQQGIAILASVAQRWGATHIGRWSNLGRFRRLTYISRATSPAELCEPCHEAYDRTKASRHSSRLGYDCLTLGKSDERCRARRK